MSKQLKICNVLGWGQNMRKGYTKDFEKKSLG